MKKFLHKNSLSLVVLLLFFGALAAQLYTGFEEWNSEIREDHGQPFTLGEYLTSGHFIEATFENWESEFLQMGMLVVLSVFLYQKGSSESKDPDKKEPPHHLCMARKKRWGKLGSFLYKNSLSLALFTLFVVSFMLHFYGSLKNYNDSRILKGLPIVTRADYLTNNRFWFESFENWQSEFLSVFCMIVFSIFLRQQGSPQSQAH